MSTSKTIKEIDENREKEDLKILEAVFFISGRYLSMPELISLSDLNPIIIGDLIERLKDKYEKEESALEIIEKNGLWKMDVCQEYSNIINKLATGSAEFSKAEQETLAIIAYKQPIKQSVVIKIRGNKAYDHIKKLSDLDLIKRKKMGHTYELSISEDFYDYFGIQDPGGGNPLKIVPKKEEGEEAGEAGEEVEKGEDEVGLESKEGEVGKGIEEVESVEENLEEE